MLELRGVAKQYLYGARLFGSLDMKIDDGQIVAFLGDEGSGKTSLLKVIAAVTDCEGQVLFDGQSLDKKPDDVIMIFDDLALFENRTGFYNLAYPLKIRGYDKQSVIETVNRCADKLGVVAILYDKMKKVPLVDRKRLAVARLFLRDAKVILVDDITRGLCKDEARQLWKEVSPILQDFAKQGKIVLFSTRDKDEALSIADKIAVLHYGELKQFGTYESVRRNPSNIWAAQAFDENYHFEKARLECKNGTLTAVTEDGFDIDLEHLRGRIVESYISQNVFVGWNSDCYDTQGERKEKVESSLRTENGYCLKTKNRVVRSDEKLDETGTLAQKGKAAVYDFTNENSIIVS